jgi:hypothetical protein
MDHPRQPQMERNLDRGEETGSHRSSLTESVNANAGRARHPNTDDPDPVR